MNLKHLTDQALLHSLYTFAQKERELLTTVLWHFRELERRRLFSDLGFSSLFAYATKKLGYSDDQAYRRINAARLLKDLPEVEEKLNSGAITLTNASLAQNLFRQEKMSTEKKREILTQLENKTTREAQEIIAAMNPKPAKSDRIRPTADDQITITFTAPKRLEEKLNKLKALLAHSHPNISLAELIEILADAHLEKLDPAKNPKRKTQTSAKEDALGSTKVEASTQDSRYIPAHLRSEVWQRDQSKCCNCETEHALEIDHIIPIASGGKTALENLRLLCRSCNQRAAIQKLGMKTMEMYL